jgi:cob(I)alamin adenosyltransferase
MLTTKRNERNPDDLTRGDGGLKSRRRNRCCNAIDELIAQVGFARSICLDVEVGQCLKTVLLELYKVGAAVVKPRVPKQRGLEALPAMVDALEAEVRRLESLPGVLAEGSLFWERPDAAALDVARTVCRRAERITIKLADEDELGSRSIPEYLSGLAYLLWLLGQLLESRRRIDS